MSRIAKTPINIPTNVNIKINGQIITIKGENGELTHFINNSVKIKHVDNMLFFYPRKGYVDGWVQAGTARSLLNSSIIGITNGFSKKLYLVGVGYRASVNNNIVNLSLGFSHSIIYHPPISIIIECPSQTEILIKGIDKQKVGQVAADLRSYRRPEPYKNKGIRYENEVIRIKETKKK